MRALTQCPCCGAEMSPYVKPKPRYLMAQEMYRAGMPLKEIAFRMGTTTNNISNMIARKRLNVVVNEA